MQKTNILTHNHGCNIFDVHETGYYKSPTMCRKEDVFARRHFCEVRGYAQISQSSRVKLLKALTVSSRFVKSHCLCRNCLHTYCWVSVHHRLWWFRTAGARAVPGCFSFASKALFQECHSLRHWYVLASGVRMCARRKDRISCNEPGATKTSADDISDPWIRDNESKSMC